MLNRTKKTVSKNNKNEDRNYKNIHQNIEGPRNVGAS